MNTTVDIEQELMQYERACAGFDPLRPDARAEVEKHWRDGVALWHELWPAGQASSRSPDQFARLQTTMTRVATIWLTPRYHGEPREPIYARIPSLRPVAENERLQELMERNSEGTIPPDEYSELVQLNEFFERLQPILCDALLALPPRSS